MTFRLNCFWARKGLEDETKHVLRHPIINRPVDDKASFDLHWDSAQYPWTGLCLAIHVEEHEAAIVASKKSECAIWLRLHAASGLSRIRL